MRLRDWLGPEEEFVPFGPRADRARAEQDAAGAEPESGSGFWDGDASLHTAVPGPELLDEPNARSPAQARLAIPWKWVGAGLAVAGLLAALLVVVFGGGSAPQHPQIQTQAAVGAMRLPQVGTTIGGAGSAVLAASNKVVSRAQARRAARARELGRPRRVVHARHKHHAPPSSGSSSVASTPVDTTSAPADTETSAAPTQAPVTEPAPTTPVETPPTTTPSPPSGGGGGSSTGGGGSNTSQSSSKAYGPTGSLGPGSSPDS